jgi:hypothetical protein
MSKRIVVVEDQFFDSGCGTPNWKKVRSGVPDSIGFLSGI